MSALASPRGYALVSVLWLVLLLTGIAAAYHAHARVEARLLTAALQRAQAEGLAEAGIWIAAHEHFSAALSQEARSNRVTRTIDVDGAAVAVTIADVSGLVNLNGAPPELLAALLAARSGLDPAEQAAVVDAILDWRDSDNTRNPAGAEDTDYAALKKSHGAKDAPFATVDELRLVRGMTPRAYRAIAPSLTVFGNHARVNTAAAPPDVLAALPRDSAAGARAPEGSYDQRFVQQTGEDIYTASAAATVGAATAHVAATLRYARGEQRRVQVLAWSDAPAGAAALQEQGVLHAP
jgi:general secretion pathway protein K